MKKRIISVVMKKRIISLLSALALTAQIVPCALADNDVKVYVNDTEMITDAPIIIENNRTLVPVRAILEYLDYNVDWDGATKKVKIAKDETTLNLIIGDTQATRDIIYKGNTHSYKNPLEVAPQIINDSTYIPLSDVANAFRLNITWDGDNREVHITQYKKGDLTPLIEFGIISDDDLNKGEYITTQEALNTIKNFQHYAIDDFKNLYVYDYLKSFDNISDESKILLSVLDYLGKHNGCIQKSIATGCQIEPATLTGILSRMEEKKLIKRQTKDGNKRSLYVYLTDEGKRLQEIVNDTFEKVENEILGGISKSEKEQFINTFFKICNNMTNTEELQ